ncbi:MAG: amino acid ABC transporter permease [Lachnospiraceae bacterium]|nr:amino acid ABC transporter permease [Lachnospiraceae bacterium]
MRFDFNFFFSVIPKLVVKIPYTMWLGTLAFLIAFVIAVLLEIMYESHNRVLRWIAGIYISYFRSTPYIMQLFIFYFGLPQMFDFMKVVTAQTALIVTIATNSSAFIAESIRGGLIAVDKGQREAALSIGLSRFDLYKEIVLPQAFVAAFPSLCNSYISMIKTTALGFAIGVIEMMSMAKLLSASALRFMEGYLAVGMIYWVLLVIIDKILKQMEKRICRHL